jgi:hypothetical protein
VEQLKSSPWRDQITSHTSLDLVEQVESYLLLVARARLFVVFRKKIAKNRLLSLLIGSLIHSAMILSRESRFALPGAYILMLLTTADSAVFCTASGESRDRRW